MRSTSKDFSWSSNRAIRQKHALITSREEHFLCFLAIWDDYDFCNHFPFQPATSATAPDAPTALPAGGGMLINQHDTSWQNDLRTRVDEMGNFLIYILHGANMHNLIVQVESAFDESRLQRGMFPFDLGQHTRQTFIMEFSCCFRM